MKTFICGLGNPGQLYQQTRHNVGFMVVDHIANSLGVNFSNKSQLSAEVAKAGDLILLKPTTFMNNSGLAVSSVTSYFQIEDVSTQLFVVHDDLDIDFGKFKVVKSGPRAHNGLLSIQEHLKTTDFWYARVGVDSRQSDRTLSGKDYVLQKFPAEQLSQVDQISEQVYQAIQDKIT